MRLIMELYVSDGFTYDCTITYPVIAESPEAALCELEELATEAARTKEDFEFGGHLFTYNAFVGWDDTVFNAPTFFTVDEYFEVVEKR